MVDKVFHDVYQALIGQQISRSTPTAPQDARAALHALTATPQQTNDTDQLANTLPTVQVCCSAALSVEPAPTVPKMPLDSRGSRRSSLPLAVHPVATTRRGAWSPPRRSCDGGIAVPACPVAHPAPPAAHRPCRRPNETTCRPCARAVARAASAAAGFGRTTRACSRRSRRRAQGQFRPPCRGSGRRAARVSASRPILLRRIALDAKLRMQDHRAVV